MCAPPALSAPSVDADASPPRAPPPRAPPPLSPVLRNALSSSLGAALVGTLVTPLDVVKVRLQAHVCPVGGRAACDDPLHVEGALDAVRKIVRHDGVRGLWRGLNVTLLMAVPTTGLYFTLYENFRERLHARFGDSATMPTALVAGACARSATATVASPLELARTSLQAGVGGADATVISVLRQVRRDSGMRAWWRGLGATLMRDAPFSAIYWSAYEALKEPSRSILPARLFGGGGGGGGGANSNSSRAARSQFGVYMGAGIGAGALAALCTVPADVIKTRRQAQLRRSVHVSATAMTRQILRSEGARGLFRGAAPRVAKVAPACAIMMASYEMFRTMLGLQRDG